jgi:hypothetical protein
VAHGLHQLYVKPCGIRRYNKIRAGSGYAAHLGGRMGHFGPSGMLEAFLKIRDAGKSSGREIAASIRPLASDDRSCVSWGAVNHSRRMALSSAVARFGGDILLAPSPELVSTFVAAKLQRLPRGL